MLKPHPWELSQRMLQHGAGKWLAGVYALLAGLVFLVIAGTMLAPVVPHVLHRFRLESEDELREAP